MEFTKDGDWWLAPVMVHCAHQTKIKKDPDFYGKIGRPLGRTTVATAVGFALMDAEKRRELGQKVVRKRKRLQERRAKHEDVGLTDDSE